MLVEKVPSLKCDKCGSYSVVMTNECMECDDCLRVTVLSVKKEVLEERCDVVVHLKRRSKKK